MFIHEAFVGSCTDTVAINQHFPTSETTQETFHFLLGIQIEPFITVYAKKSSLVSLNLVYLFSTFASFETKFSEHFCLCLIGNKLSHQVGCK